MTNKPSQPEDQPKADERNIVAVDPSYEGASLEDQLFLFWHNYRKVILIVCALAVLALAGWAILTWVQERREARINEEFQQATSMDELKAFADRNAPHELAGVAYLRAADYHFENGEFGDAASFYEQAATHLEDPALEGRASIGRGVALALADQQNEALNHFEAVARNSDNFGAIRAEAHYHAAGLAVELDQISTAHDHIERVLELDRSQMWSARAMGLRRTLPDPEEETAAEPAAD